MLTTVSFEIGAIFLLVAMLLYGTVSGFLPRMFHAGRTAPIILGLFVLAFAVYRFGPDLRDAWRTIVATAPPAAPRPPVSPCAVRKSAPPPARAAQPVPVRAQKPAPQEQWKTTVVDDSVPTAVDPVPSPKEPDATEQPAPSAGNANSDEDPYESGFKRGIKRVGRFLHIRGKKTEP